MEEQLLLRPLPDGELMLYFNLSVSSDSDDLRHLEAFPRPIAELVVGTGLISAKLSLNSGRWLHEDWGGAPDPVPFGSEVSARFHHVRGHRGWPVLRRGLETLLCASHSNPVDRPINAAADIDLSGALLLAASGGPTMVTNTTSGPTLSTDGILDFLAASPRQHVCTESTAAFASLWPCRAAAGIMTLLGQTEQGEIERMRHARYRSLRLDISSLKPEGWVVKMGFTMVLPHVEVYSKKSSRGAHGKSAGLHDDILRGLLSQGLTSCGLAASSSLTVETQLYTAIATSAPDDTLGASEGLGAPFGEVESTGGERLPCGAWRWLLNPFMARRLSIGWRRGWRREGGQRIAAACCISSLLRVRRHLGRDDGLRGLMVLELTNMADSPINLSLVDRLPAWFMVHMHSLSAFVGHVQVHPSQMMRQLRYLPAHPPRGEQLIAFKASVPSASSLVLTARYSVALPSVDQLPPDASRGLEIGPASISYNLADGTISKAYTDPVLVPLLLPDLSMPYNVISSSSTLIACFVGSMFNLLSRRLHPR